MAMMRKFAKLGRVSFALLIAFALMVPSFAHAMPMQAGLTMSMTCDGHHCADHQSVSPSKMKASGCVATACTSPHLYLPAPLTSSLAAYYSIDNEQISEALLTGILRIPAPYLSQTVFLNLNRRRNRAGGNRILLDAAASVWRRKYSIRAAFSPV